MLQYLDRYIKQRIISLIFLISGIFAVKTVTFAQCLPESLTTNFTINENCPKDIIVNGLIENTIVWTTVSPGQPGDYDGQLSCTSACSATNLSAPTGISQLVVQVSGTSCTTGNPWSGLVTVTINPEIQIAFANPVTYICSGSTSTSLNATVTGGTPNLTYTWIGNGIISGQGTPSIIVNAAGTYTLEVSDQTGCPPASRDGEVQLQVLQPSANAGINQTICQANQSSLVSLNGAIQNSNAAFWSGGQGSYNPSNQDLQTVYVPSLTEIQNGHVDLILQTAQNGNCPEAFDTIRVYFSSPILNQALVTNPNCNQANGSINQTISGGNNPYLFSWSNGQTTEDLVGMSSGQYNVQVTDSVGCTTPFSYTLTTVAMLQSNGAISHVSCNGQATGAINLTVIGGTIPYQFSWSNGSSSEDLTNLSAGTYSVNITDANGCNISNSFVISQAVAMQLSQIHQNVLCFGQSTGVIDVTVSGGVSPYQYSWNNGSTTQDIQNLLAGNYSLIVTDANNCTNNIQCTISQPVGALTLTTSQQNINCTHATGSIDLTVNGGTSNYTYLWNNGTTTEDITNLAAGSYAVSITDANGCQANTSVNISQTISAFQLTETHQNVWCHGQGTGSINIETTGGSLPITYLWSNGATTQDLFNLIAGNYSLNATDANGCTTSIQVSITEPSLSLSSSITGVNIDCTHPTGGVLLTINGGVSPYAYSWSNGMTSQNLVNLIAGTYTVTITDANGCSVSNSVTIQNNASNLSLTENHVNVNCFGQNNGSIDVTISGGINPYSYSWSNAATTQDLTSLIAGTYSLVTTDGNGCTANLSVIVSQPPMLTVTNSASNITCAGLTNGSINTFVQGGSPNYSFAWSNSSSTQNLSNLSVGNYSLVVTDSHGCTASTQSVITQPNPLSFTSNIQNLDCEFTTGAINLNISGGTTPYSTQWSNGSTAQNISGLTPGNYTSVVTDSNGCFLSQSFDVIQMPGSIQITEVHSNVSCFGMNNGWIDITISGGADPYLINWSNGGPTEDLMDLTAGNYTVTVLDQQNCQAELTLIITEPNPLMASTTVTNAFCVGGNSFVDLTVSGGIPGYGYTWNNGTTTQDLTNPTWGSYSVVITDANGCTTNASVNVLQPSPALILTETHSNVNCTHPTGSIDLTVTGGSSPFNYSWSNGQTIEDISGLNPGTYSITVTDINGCTSTMSIVINQEPNIFQLTETHTNVSCVGQSDGAIDVTQLGGVSPISYSWSNNASTQDISNLGIGTYVLTAIDGNGCTNSLQISITQIPSMLASFVVTDVLCHGQSNGSIDLSVSGGTPTYSYNWNNGASNQDLQNISAGIYTVNIMDSHGCMISAQTTVNDPSIISLSETHLDIDCTHPLGSIDLTVTGGVSPYIYSWSNNATTQDISNLNVGTYQVIVTDFNECSSTLSISISQASTLLQLSETHTDVICNGAFNGSIDVSVISGTPTITYNWSNGLTTQDLNNIQAGSYTIIGTDALGCKDTLNVTINQPNPLVANTNATNVSCYGLQDGAINLTANGGTPAYSYLWSNGATTQNINGLLPGTYSVTITDDHNCVTIAQETITQPLQPLSSTEVHVNIDCTHPTGSVDLTVIGGTSPYIYSWSNNATSQDLVNLTAGTYTVNILDANGCSSSNTIVISQTLSNLILTESHVTPLCNGQSNGSINITTTGGTSPISYLWNNGATTEDLMNISSGNYSLTATDAMGCTANISVLVSQPAVLSANSVPTNVTCFGLANGSINLSVSGGTLPYFYSWSNTATSEDISNLTPGNYSVTITDVNNCTTTSSASISQPTAALSSTETHVNIDCTHPTGSIDLTVVGGTSPYQYSWSNGATTQDISGIIAGTYTVTITDVKLCTTSNIITITTDPNALTLSETHTNISCNGQTTGSIDLTVTGGTPNYNYTWSNGFTTQDLSNLNVGTYSVSVSDAAGCTSSMSIVVTSPPVLELDAISSNLTCYNNSTGIIDLIVNGGQAPHTYAWSNSATTQDLSGLSAGTYSVVVTDAGNCTESYTVTLTQPNLLTSSEVHTNVNCNGQANGFVNLSVTGGTQVYHFTWSNGATTEDINGVVAGIYTVNIVDSLGCTTNNTISITQPVVLSATLAKVNVNCFGNNTGSINLTVTGGTAPYIFNWSNGATTEDLSNLIAGTYNVSITDAHGCTTTGTATITQNTALQIGGVVTNVTCNGLLNGAINITPTGGVPTYVFNWSNGATTEDLSNKGAGTYSITITDQLGCTKNTVYTITQPQPIVLTQTHVNILCSGGTGSIDLTVNGGTSPYTYAWSNSGTTQDIGNLSAGTYSVLVTDVNGCSSSLNGIVISSGPTAINVNSQITNVNCFGQSTGMIDLTVTGGISPYSYGWSNGATTQDPTNLSAGTYNLILTDANGCVYNNSYVVNQPASALTITETHNDILCAGTATGLINITVSGGTSPYSYVWSNGATTEDANNIPAGTYTVTVTDGNGCLSTGNISLSELYAPLTLTETHINVLCYGNSTGYINLSVSGGAPAYSYSWSNGSSLQDVGGLAIGTYSVSVTDYNGCNATLSVNISQPASALTLSESHVNLICVNDSTGSINLTPTGGTAPYVYSWSNGQTSEDISNLPFGNYNVLVTDFNNCTANLMISIANPVNGIVLSGNVTNVNCFGGATGAIDVSISGGTPTFSYSWSNNAQGQDLVNLFPGTYTVTVMDAIGCDLSQTYTITQPLAPLSFVPNVIPVYCFGENTGAVTLDVNGGTPGYSYSWSNTATTEDLYNLSAGSYSVTITDANGCTASYVGVVNQPSAPIMLNLTSTSSLCYGGTSGGVNLSVSGGVPGYTYSWSNGSTTEDLVNVGAGTYTVTVQDQNGCLMSGSIAVGQPQSAMTLSQTTTHVSCYGGSNGYINLSAVGGTPGYNYAWNNGATTEDLSSISSGSYSVVVTDANGCSSNLSVLVNQPSSLVSVNGTVNNVLCYGGTTGSITSNGQGGTSPYSYAWSNGETTSQISGLSAGVYTVTVSDANGCNTTQSWSVTQPSALSLQSTNTNILCYGQSSGSITSQASGGVTPYSYTWTNGMTGSSILNIPAGPYFVTVLDGNGCSATFSDTVYQPSTALTLSTNIVNNNCFGAATGSIDNTVSGGTSPYQYQWNTSATTQDLSNLLAGTYVITIMDANGCLLNNSLQVTQPPISIVASMSHVNVSCLGGGNGSINLTATGTGAPFSYSWNNGSTTEDISGLVPGVYTVTITDNSGCTTNLSTNITQPSTSLSVQSLVSNVLCTGNNTGSIDLTVNGGTTPYFYNWSNGIGTQDLSNVLAGTYSVIVTDNNNCQVFDTLTITEPANILSGTFTQTNVVCFGQATGSIDLTVTGGTPGYLYSWNNFALSQDLVSIPAGFYSVVVTDGNGCTFNTSAIITEPSQGVQISPAITNVDCYGNNTGAINISVTGGAVPYTFLWSNAATTEDISALIAGTYILQTTDANGCFSQTSYQVLQSSQPLSLSSVMTPEGCYGGSNGGLNLSVVGGTGPFTYAWTSPTGYTATTEDIQNVIAGIYTVTVTDNNGCSGQLSDTVSEPASYSLSHVLTNVDCFGNSTGAVNITVIGGTPGYLYNWSNGSTTEDLG
ncbi:MAG: hypothetical protein ACKOXP_04700, partial [Flavobacteriales bacterium]